jgi:hypothetical protein
VTPCLLRRVIKMAVLIMCAPYIEECGLEPAGVRVHVSREGRAQTAITMQQMMIGARCGLEGGLYMF